MSIVDLIIKRSREISSYIIERRRDFHMYPELKYEERRTSKIVAEELEKMGYKVERMAETGVVGTLDGGEGYIVALRADMDALPVQEENDVPYRSRVPGKMHACGHDAHTAMLLGAAKILSEVMDELKGGVKLIFQPAEEGGLGAKKMIEEGALDGVDAIFGIHVWSEAKSGSIGIKEGPLLASADAFRVKVRGKGGHGASPHLSIDPITLAADLVNAYQKIVSREVNPIQPAVVSVTSIKAGTTFNVIPEELEMLGTIRTFDMDIRDMIIRRLEEITVKYGDAMRCEARFELTKEKLPPTANNKELAEFARRVLKPLGNLFVPEPSMGAEDFSLYVEKVPGLFVVLGTGNEEKGIVYPHHHPRFDVDEDALWIGTAIHGILATQYLSMKEKEG